MKPIEKEEVLNRLHDYFAEKGHIRFAYLFGSVAKKEANGLSDIDVAVMCEGGCNRLELMAELDAMFGVKVDVVDLGRLKNYRLLKDIIKEGIPVKRSSEQDLWEIDAYHKALDFMSHTRSVYGY